MYIAQARDVVYAVPALARYPDVTTQGCWYYAYAAMSEIGRNPSVRGFAHDSRARRGMETVRVHQWALACK